MAETTLEKAICENCGVDVRENTQFCYNCGGRVAPDREDEVHTTAESNGVVETDRSANAQAALDDLAKKLDADEKDNAELLARAAAERRRARVKPRRSREVVWESIEVGSERLLMFMTLLICLITSVVVFLIVFWK